MTTSTTAAWGFGLTTYDAKGAVLDTWFPEPHLGTPPDDYHAPSILASLEGEDPVRDVVAVVCNLSPVPRESYRLGLPQAGRWVEAVNTDSSYYGGSNTGNLGGIAAEETGWGGQPFSAELTLPPLSVLWLVPERS